MFTALSKIFNIISSIMLAILLAFFSYSMIFTYNLGRELSNRDNFRRWLTQEDVKEAYIDYLVDMSYSMLPESLYGIFSQQQIRNQFDTSANSERVDQIIDTTVDNVYDWLEGKSDTIIIETTRDDVLDELGFLNELLGDKLGILSTIISPTDLLKISDSLNIIDLEKLSANNIPYLYQSLLTLPKKLLIVCIVLCVLILLSNRSWRYGGALIGIAIAVIPAYTLYLNEYLPLEVIVDPAELIERLSLPSLQEMPEFIVLIYQNAKNDVMQNVNKHALITMIAGIVLLVITQLGFREHVIDDVMIGSDTSI